MSALPRQPHHYRPGVGIVLLNSQGLVFHGKRRDQRDPPWQLPQGGIDERELPLQAALREIREELGLDRASFIEFRPDWLAYDYPDRSISSRAALFRGQRHLWFLLGYDGDDRDIDIFGKHGEFSEWRWSRPADIINSVIDFKRPSYRKIFQYFSPSIQRVAMTGSFKAREAGTNSLLAAALLPE